MSWNEGWSMPAELRRCTPRSVELTLRGWAMAAVAIMLAAGAVLTPALMLADRARRQELRARIEREGETAQATVVQVGRTREEHPRRYAVYQYVAGGTTYTGRVTFRRGGAQPGERLPVRYLAGDPGRSWAGGHEPAGTPIAVIALLPLGMAAGAAALGIWLWRQRRLLAEGRVAPARVVGSKRARSQERSGYLVEYELTVLSGAVRRVKIERPTKPPDGAVVTMVYDRENPRASAVYPMQLMRVAK